MARQRKAPEGGGGSAWLNTYADMVTLLLCFFVLMISMSTINEEKFNAFLESFQNIDKEVLEEIIQATQQGGGDGGGNSQDMTEAAMDTLFEKLEEYVQENNMQDSVSIAKIEDVIYIRFDSAVFFEPDKYTLRKDSYKVLEFIGDGLKEYEKEIKLINICGHTAKPAYDPDPEKTWQLAGNRAAVVANYFELNKKIDNMKLVVMGYGDNFPVASNDTEAGMKKNRRVELVIIGKDSNVNTNIYDALQELYNDEEYPKKGDVNEVLLPQLSDNGKKK
ncbi:MAG: flagellar motor protein MotB [Clostridia bacterium]|nr:flagellar motor protein MotB [Clostridia bacterium]